MAITLWACQDGQGGYDIGAGDVTLASVRNIAATDGQRVADLYRQQQGADFDARALAMRFVAAPAMLAALKYTAGKLASLADVETDDARQWIIDDIAQVVEAATPTGE